MKTTAVFAIIIEIYYNILIEMHMLAVGLWATCS